MDSILLDLKGVICYLDDVVVYAKDRQELEERLRKVLQRFDKVGIRLNRNKCKFAMEELYILGHIVSSEGIKPDNRKIEAVLNFPIPKNIEMLRSFLGTCGFLRKFIPNFSKLAEPLNNLTRKNVRWNWDLKTNKAFQDLKESLTKEPCLAYYNLNSPTELITDASPIGLGAVIIQTQQNGIKRPIAYASRSLTDTEKGYSQIEKETLGCNSKIELEITTIYDFEIEFIQGKQNIADIFSRQPLSKTSDEKWLEDYVHKVLSITSEELQALSLKEIKVCTEQDPLFQKLKEMVQKGVWPYPLNEEFKCFYKFKDELSIFDNLILKGSRILLPSKLIKRVLRIAHETHQGMTRTKQLLREKYFWINMDFDIENLIRNCPICVRNQTLINDQPLQIVPLPSKPWMKLGIDIVGPIGHQYVLTVVDYYSSYPEAMIIEDISSKTIIKKLMEIFARHGFHMKFSEEGKDWKDLSRILMSYRTTPNRSTGKTPAFLLFSREIKTKLSSLVNDAEEDESNIKEFNMVYKEKMKTYNDIIRKASPHNFEIGNLVYVANLNNGKLDSNFRSEHHVILENTSINYFKLVNTKNGKIIHRNAKHLKHVPTQETNQGISDLIPEESQENLSSDSTRIEHHNSSDVQIPDDNSLNQDKDTSLNRPSSSRTGSTFNPVVSDRLDAEAIHQLPPEVSTPLPTTKYFNLDGKLRRSRRLQSLPPLLVEMVKEEEKPHVQPAAFTYLQQPRNPPNFSGKCCELAHLWLKDYSRVAAHNGWDESMCLANVVFFLEGAARCWFDNVEESITTWKTFKEEFTRTFGDKEDYARRIESSLKVRAQKPDESVELYIQDVLNLCRQLNPNMSEEDRVSHLMKGVTENIYRALLAIEVTTTGEFTQHCRRIEKLNKNRISSVRFERIPTVSAINENEYHPLKEMIREIIREELRSAPNELDNLPPPQGLEDRVWQKVEQNLAPIDKTPVFHSGRAVKNFRSGQQNAGEAVRRKTDEFRTRENIPICFYCNRPGHVAKHCWDRRRDRDDNEPSRTQNRFYYGRRRPGSIYMADFMTPHMEQSDRNNSPRRNLPRSSSPYPGRGRPMTRRRYSRSPDRTPSRSPHRDDNQFRVSRRNFFKVGSSEQLMRMEQISACISPELPLLHKTKLLELLENFSEVFGPIDKTTFRIITKHRINTGDAKPSKKMRVSPSERKVIQEEVDRMMEMEVVQPSESPWASPVVLVRKKDGSVRFCVDYRGLNKMTKKDVYPLPRVDDALDCLKGANIYSTIDLKAGYWQIGIDEADREETAFITPDGLFEFKAMPFGLCNAPATFERMMDNLLKGLRWTICLCYLDDVVIFADNFPDHLRRLEVVLNCFKRAGLKLNPGKCSFGASNIKILGHQVDKDGIRPDDDKIKAVSQFPIPKNLQQLRSFLGLSSYYRRFIKNYADIARPLNSLLSKGTKFQWNTDQERAFQKLKNALTSKPVLGHFDDDAPTELHTDASGYGIGAVLAQKQLPLSSRTCCPTICDSLADLSLSQKKKGVQLQLTMVKDLLCLCKEVDPQMSEEDKISHLMKGIAEELYQALLPRDVQSTEQFITECRRVEALRCRRVTPTKYERLPNVASLCDQDDREDLSSLIRKIVREEIQQALDSPQEEPKIAANEDLVREEIVKTLASISEPKISPPQAPRPVSNPKFEAQPRNLHPTSQYQKQGRRRDTNEWRTTEGRPICFYCGRPGHVVRYCRDRKRHNEERRKEYFQRKQDAM
ncbi:hypothetical protein LAZ67_3002201, partial [Cordylochernes scorpioides]